MSTQLEDDNPDQHVIDEGDVTQNAVLRRIQGCRDDIAEVKARRIQEALEGTSNDWSFRRAYYRAVDALCGELQSYLRNDEFPLAGKYWEEVPIGEIVFEPPEVVSQPSQAGMDAALKQGGKQLALCRPRNSVKPKSYTVQGLRDFNAADDVLTESWQVMYGPEVSANDIRSRNHETGVQVKPRASRHEPITVHRRQPLPADIIQKAESLCVKFAYELGMDVDFEYEDYESTEPLS